MPPLRPVLPLLLMALLAGCQSGEAFVDRNYATVNVQKEKLPGYRGSVTVCYTDATPEETRDRLADEACAAWDLKARLTVKQRWQCRLTVPHLATYACYDPEMRRADGAYVNPFSKADVAKWKREQEQEQGGEGTQR